MHLIILVVWSNRNFCLFWDFGLFLNESKPPTFFTNIKCMTVLGQFPSSITNWAEDHTIVFRVKNLPRVNPSPFPGSRIWHPAHSHRLPVLHNHLIDNLPANNTFPSPKVLIKAVKFIIDHDTTATKTLHKNISLQAIR